MNGKVKRRHPDVEGIYIPEYENSRIKRLDGEPQRKRYWIQNHEDNAGVWLGILKHIV